MQATSTTALEPVTSNQSLAWPPEIHETKKKELPTPHIRQQAALQATGLNIYGSNHKRPVTCKVARFEGKMNSTKKRNEEAERPLKRQRQW